MYNTIKFRIELYQLQSTNKQFNKLKTQMKSILTNNKSDSNSQRSQNNVKQIKQKISVVKNQQKIRQNSTTELIKQIEQQLLQVGNIVHRDVIVSKDQDLNRNMRYYAPECGVVSQKIKEQQLNKWNKTQQKYQNLNQQFRISDLKRGQKVAGHRGFFLQANGLKLALALTQFGVQFLEQQGYDLYQTPAIIFENILKENCQLQTVENDMYRLQGENSLLIATSEQSLAAYYRGEVLQKMQLPKRMAGYSTCFRKEAGAHGKDIHGLFRVHQFEKVQQFVICQPEKSQQQMERMIRVSQRFYQQLKIPYRIVDIVSGELNDAAVRKFDLQAWFPSQRKYRQLVSVSNCTDYQSRMSKVLYRKGDQTANVHMLNGTLTAIQRTLTCILQNYYDSKRDCLIVPEKLQKYVGRDIIHQKNK